MSKRVIIVLTVLVLAVIAGIVWFANRDDKSSATPVLSVAAQNQTKNVDAANTSANAGDVIVYTLTAENQSDKVIEGYIMEVNISEITDKASLLDASGASYNAATNSLVWTPLDVPANESITKQFSVKVNAITADAANKTMKVKFNNEVNVAITSSPVVAGNNTPTPTAPVTGPSGLLPIFLAVLATAGILGVRKYRFAKV